MKRQPTNPVYGLQGLSPVAGMVQQFLFRHCLLCGGFPTDDGTDNCRTCWQEIENWFGAPVSNLELSELSVRYGFQWQPGGRQRKVALTYGLKGQSCMATWRQLAQFFMKTHGWGLSDRRYLLLPIPGRRASRDDHAWRWARSLAPWVGGHVLQVFHGLKAGPQKELDRRARLQQTLLAKEGCRDWLETQSQKGWKVVLVDDVVTTGATAEAAREALKGVPITDIWALAYRLPDS